jgi:hypothetical protein
MSKSIGRRRIYITACIQQGVESLTGCLSAMALPGPDSSFPTTWDHTSHSYALGADRRHKAGIAVSDVNPSSASVLRSFTGRTEVRVSITNMQIF